MQCTRRTVVSHCAHTRIPYLHSYYPSMYNTYIYEFIYWCAAVNCSVGHSISITNN